MEQDLEGLYQAICRLLQGTRTFRGDLHLHTPYSGDYRDKCGVEDVVSKAAQIGLDLIALTDHNSFDGYAALPEAIVRGSQPVVFPGVEITAPAGERNIHLLVLAIFEPGTSVGELNDLLARIGIRHPQRGREEALAQELPGRILEEIDAMGGIGIAAHADAENGIVGGLRGQQRISLIRHARLYAVELNNLNNKRFFDGSDPNYQRRLACIQSSDSHSLATIGNRFTVLRMERPSIQGLKVAFLDPETHVGVEEVDHSPTLFGLGVKGGSLAPEPGKWFAVRFNIGLNCIVGGRGSGKSTIIEIVRAFCEGGDGVRIIRSYGVSTAVLLVQFEGRLFACVMSESTRTTYTREHGGVWPIQPLPIDVILARVYSQGAFYDLAKKGDLTVVLDAEVDAKLAVQVTAAKGELERVTRRLQDPVAWPAPGRDGLVMTVSTVQKRLAQDIAAIKSGRSVDRQANYLTGLRRTVLRQLQDYLPEDLVNRMRAQLHDLADKSRSAHKSHGAQLSYRRMSIYNHFLASPQSELVLKDISHISYVVHQLSASALLADPKTSADVQRSIQAYLDLEERLAGLRTELAALVNHRCMGVLEVKLEDRVNRDAYIRLFRTAGIGAGTAEQIAESVHPRELLRFAVNRMEIPGLLPEQALAVQISLLSASGFQRYLACPRPTTLVRLPELNKYRELSNLSIGQQCSVLLNIFLRSGNSTVPMVIDQPEDHLDNSYIEQSLVPSIRVAKQNRQIIFATHNANLAILGDADLFLVLRSRGVWGLVESAGSIDNAVVRETAIEVLEGGRRALERRVERYQL